MAKRPEPIMIAELGCVHVQEMDRAKMLIELAAGSGADIVKFQKRNPIECVHKDLQDKPHPNPQFAWGDTYLEHRQNLEFNIEQHKELKKTCEDFGVEYASSVWDMTSAKEIISLNPNHIKIPSACNSHWEMMELLYDAYDGMIHISTGMTDIADRDNICQFLTKDERYMRTIVYHCTSRYPCPVEELYLDEIFRLTFKYPHIGFSNHNPNIATDIAAFTHGATYFERHFIDKRSFRHTDAQASLEPHDFMDLSRNLDDIYKALQPKPELMTDIERVEQHKLRAYEPHGLDHKKYPTDYPPLKIIG